MSKRRYREPHFWVPVSDGRYPNIGTTSGDVISQMYACVKFKVSPPVFQLSLSLSQNVQWYEKIRK